MRKRSIRIAAGLTVLVLLLGAGSYWQFVQTYHFKVVQDGVLYRDGLQDMRRYQNSYRRFPFKAVVNIQSDDNLAGKYHDLVMQEQAFCAKNGVQWIHLPIKERTPPTREQIEEFLKIVDDPANQPVLVHCSQGIVRTGMMTAVWQLERMGYDNQRAVEEITRFGHSSDPVVNDFVAHYKPSSHAEKIPESKPKE